MTVTPPVELPASVTAPAARTPRRARYAGTHPRRFAEKYKELRVDPDEVAHIEAKGRTAAGTHRPIAVAEVVAALGPSLRPGAVLADCTLGFGGHARELLARVAPGGVLYAFDADGGALAAAETRLRAWLSDSGTDARLVCSHANYASLEKTILQCEPGGCDAVLADLGCSSMQLDDPRRGFSLRRDGPLDMRLDASRGSPASERLTHWSEVELAELLAVNADEPHAARLASRIRAAARSGGLQTTGQLAAVVRAALPSVEADKSVRRVFQAIRIAVNDEYRRLDAMLEQLPRVLRPGGRAAVISFHSGEDRRVKLAFKAGVEAGWYSAASDVVRPSMAEQRNNSRSSCAKLRSCIRSSWNPLFGSMDPVYRH